jgi:hypothetical protein
MFNERIQRKKERNEGKTPSKGTREEKKERT